MWRFSTFFDFFFKHTTYLLSHPGKRKQIAWVAWKSKGDLHFEEFSRKKWQKLKFGRLFTRFDRRESRETHVLKKFPGKSDKNWTFWPPRSKEDLRLTNFCYKNPSAVSSPIISRESDSKDCKAKYHSSSSQAADKVGKHSIQLLELAEVTEIFAF